MCNQLKFKQWSLIESEFRVVVRVNEIWIEFNQVQKNVGTDFANFRQCQISLAVYGKQHNFDPKIWQNSVPKDSNTHN